MFDFIIEMVLFVIAVAFVLSCGFVFLVIAHSLVFG